MLKDILNEEGVIYFWDKIKENFATKDAIDNIISKVATAPTYTEPVGTINQSNASVEYGSDWSYSHKAKFTKNDAGNLTSATFDGIDFSSSEILVNEKTMTITRSDITTTQTISATFNYADGEIKNNNFDIPDSRGQILAGSVSAQFTITPFYYYFYDSVSDSWTSTSENVRALTHTEESSSKTLSTGTTNKIFVVALPSNKSITKVIDDTAMQADITSEYVLQGTTTVTNGSTNMEYNVYKMEMAVPYTSSHNHKITIG